MIYSTTVLLVFLISYLFKNLETFFVRIFLGMLAVVLGAFLVFY